MDEWSDSDSDNTQVVPPADDMSFVRLIVVNQRQKKRECKASLKDYVRSLKETLTYSEPSSIDLVHNGIIMKDNFTLSQYDVKDSDYIQVVDKKFHVAEGAGSVDWVFPAPQGEQPKDFTLGGILEDLRRKVPSRGEKGPQNALAGKFEFLRKYNKEARKRKAQEKGKGKAQGGTPKQARIYKDYTLAQKGTTANTLSQAELQAMHEFVPQTPPRNKYYRKHIALIPQI